MKKSPLLVGSMICFIGAFLLFATSYLSNGNSTFDNAGSCVDIAVAEGAKQISFQSGDTNVNVYDLSSYSAPKLWFKLSGSNVYTTNPGRILITR